MAIRTLLLAALAVLSCVDASWLPWVSRLQTEVEEAPNNVFNITQENSGNICLRLSASISIQLFYKNSSNQDGLLQVIVPQIGEENVQGSCGPDAFLQLSWVPEMTTTLPPETTTTTTPAPPPTETTMTKTPVPPSTETTKPPPPPTEPTPPSPPPTETMPPTTENTPPPPQSTETTPPSPPPTESTPLTTENTPPPPPSTENTPPPPPSTETTTPTPPQTETTSPTTENTPPPPPSTETTTPPPPPTETTTPPQPPTETPTPTETTNTAPPPPPREEQELTRLRRDEKSSFEATVFDSVGSLRFDFVQQGDSYFLSNITGVIITINAPNDFPANSMVVKFLVTGQKLFEAPLGAVSTCSGVSLLEAQVDGNGDVNATITMTNLEMLAYWAGSSIPTTVKSCHSSSAASLDHAATFILGTVGALLATQLFW